MKKRNALMVGVLVIAGVVSSVAILAKKKQIYHKKPIHTAPRRGMRYKTHEQALEQKKRAFLQASKDKGLKIKRGVKEHLEDLITDEDITVELFQPIIGSMEKKQGIKQGI